jgi:DNA primase
VASVVTLGDKIRFIESVFGAGKLAANSRNFDVKCPLPECSSGDKSKKKLSILVEDDRCHCWTCGYRGHTLAPLIRKYGSREQLLEYRDRFMPEEEAKRFSLVDDKEPEKLKLPHDFQLLAKASLHDPDTRAAWKYIEKRGLSRHDVWYFKLGVSNEPRWIRRVIMPSFNANGELNHFVGRAIDDRRRPKYDNPDVKKLPIVFNEINVDWSQRLVICEGPFDLVKCGENAVPLLGSDLNEESRLFNMIVANNTPIALALDNDMRLKKTPALVKKLTEYDIDVVVVDVSEHGDPGEMSKEEFSQALKDAKAPTWKSSFSERLAMASEVSLGSRRNEGFHLYRSR